MAAIKLRDVSYQYSTPIQHPVVRWAPVKCERNKGDVPFDSAHVGQHVHALIDLQHLYFFDMPSGKRL